ncbi:ribosome small subunit-dependent GTPase A [bacterium]|nr:ribosome small subunit-dependent GTPase A [bacterium]
MPVSLPGWRPGIGKRLGIKPNANLARVIEQNKHHYLVWASDGIKEAEIAGRLFYTSDALSDLPVVGDWVDIERVHNERKVRIRAIHTRYSKLSRKVVGKRTTEQVLVANIDQILVVQGIDSGFNIRRIERFAVVARDSGASVSIVLTKIDMCLATNEFENAVRQAVPEGPIFLVNNKTGAGIDAVTDWIKPGFTVVVLGASGVGKSSLINRILGEDLLPTQDVSTLNYKGMHTTTKRELIRLPNGGIIIDTPGIRELQLWDGEDGLQDAFSDIQDLAVSCKFTNCTHTSEIGCAVNAAIESGQLPPDRLENYHKLRLEKVQIVTVRQRTEANRKKRHLRQAKKGYNRTQDRTQFQETQFQEEE